VASSPLAQNDRLPRRRLPPLNALRAFEAVARHLNITQAADELSVTPGAVSQQVQNLEDYLGVALFRRTTKGLSLTDAAQSAVPVLHEAFDRLAEAASILQPSKDPQHLTVSVAPSFAAKWLTPRLARFNEQHPDIDVWLSASMELVDFTKADVDLAIRYGRGAYAGLESRRLMSERVIPVISPALLATIQLTTPSDLADCVLLHDESPDADPSCPTWPMWLAARGIRDVDGTRGPRFNQSSLIIEAAVAGRGVGLAKRTLAQEDIAAGRLVAPFEIETAVEFAYYLVYPRKSGWRPQVKSFITWLNAEARESD
jgi:LysR family transcriptional regulator, glycine cleavage system transcriptional activator